MLREKGTISFVLVIIIVLDGANYGCRSLVLDNFSINICNFFSSESLSNFWVLMKPNILIQKYQ